MHLGSINQAKEGYSVLMEGLPIGLDMQFQSIHTLFDQIFTVYSENLEKQNITFCGIQVKN
jgi:hypothetical protein